MASLKNLSLDSSTDSFNSVDPNLTEEVSPRAQQSIGRDQKKDKNYWERRKRNNVSAKRSREVRRAREQETITRAALLERQNIKLMAQIETLREEIDRLRTFLYSRNEF